MNSQRRLDCATLYNAPEAVVERTFATLANLGGHAALVVDNSTQAEKHALSAVASRRYGIPVYRPPSPNIGTGGALELALLQAEAQKCDWLHYLDQDSVPSPGYVEEIHNDYERPQDVAAIGCVETNARRGRAISCYHPARYLISSGTLFRVSALREIGGFADTFFLDLVDHEFSLALRSRGWSLEVNGRRAMHHTIGDPLGKVGSYHVTAHPAWRRRLMWRNTILISRLYWNRFPMQILKHLAIRIADAVILSVRVRDFGELASAAAGCRDGAVAPLTRKASERTSTPDIPSSDGL